MADPCPKCGDKTAITNNRSPFWFLCRRSADGYYSVPRTLLIILTGIIGTRTSTAIPMPAIRIHITPFRQTLITVAIGVTAVSIITTLTATSSPE
jgi:hypothetical protein